MWKGLQRKPGSALPATESEELSEGSGAHLREYRPAIDARAQRLIARIQRDHNDTEAVLALKEHYARHDDLPSLANLMEGWAQTLRDDRSAAELRELHGVPFGLMWCRGWSTLGSARTSAPRTTVGTSGGEQAPSR